MVSIQSNPTMLTIETFRSPGDGCLGYLVVDEGTGSALAIDPRLDQVGSFQERLTASGWRLEHVLDTHTHADHLSGVWALARATKAVPVAHAASRATRIVRRVAGGNTLALGGQRVQILDAPGHTPDSIALLVAGHLFTGDALFVGGVGRTDFPGGSASALFDTLGTFKALPAATVVHPGHDYGGRAVTTLGEELTTNPALLERDRESFAARFGGRVPPPAGMAAIIRHNVGEDQGGTITPVELEELRLGEDPPIIVDVRSALEFESEHIERSVNVPLEQLGDHVDGVPSHGDLVLVCRSGIRATMGAETLAQMGRRARVLEGGILAWRRARLPLRQGRKRLAVDRQVQLIAGGMVLIGSVLAAFVNPWFLVVPAFFGAGLTFAGATGTCGLALVLTRLPWNRPREVAESAAAACAADGAKATCAAAPGEGLSPR